MPGLRIMWYIFDVSLKLFDFGSSKNGEIGIMK